ncbi:MAG: beta-propeller domain-containing protein, partial [Proteobacteria bacterium]|nr:beta-propeller domain-containing protein [Pseudomonadota bacterium]
MSNELKSFDNCLALDQWLKKRPEDFYRSSKKFGLGGDGRGVSLGLRSHNLGSGFGNFGSGFGGAGGIGESVRNNGPGGTKDLQVSQASSSDHINDVTIGPRDFTKSNNQIRNIDESDFVKTNGKYLYYAENARLHILKIWPQQESKEVSSIDFPNRIESLSLVGANSLLVFVKSKMPEEANFKINTGTSLRNVLPKFAVAKTDVSLFDVASPDAPRLKKTVELTGDFSTARVLPDQTVLIVTKGTPTLDNESSLLPLDALQKSV